jgi:hypothetical protein
MSPQKKIEANEGLAADTVKHLEFIQDIVNRMGSNSFQMKGWMVTIVSALLAIYADKQNHVYALVGILPTAIFWFLDSYYLWQERKFRAVYSDILKHPGKVPPFTMPVHLYSAGKYSFWDVFTSMTILPLYLPVVMILLAVYLFF